MPKKLPDTSDTIERWTPSIMTVTIPTDLSSDHSVSRTDRQRTPIFGPHC